MTLNVCGLKSKLITPEFQELIQYHDIVGLQETKCDDLDTLELSGYTIYTKNRKQFMKRKSGGIAIAYKKCLENYITPIETDSKLVLWFRISDKLTRKGTFLCGVVYIPPQISDYAAENPYDEIEREMNLLSANCESVLLLGDYNSRIKNLIDYIVPDSDIFESINQREIFGELQSDMAYFDESEYFSLHRQNSDLGVNNYGYQMTEFCKDNNLYILNGRCNEDSGKTTCKSVSAIDYFVSSPNILPLLQHLYVHDLCCQIRITQYLLSSQHFVHELKPHQLKTLRSNQNSGVQRKLMLL